MRDRIQRRQGDHNRNGKRQTNTSESANVEEEEPNPHTIKRISKGTEISKLEEISSGHRDNAQETHIETETTEGENAIKTNEKKQKKSQRKVAWKQANATEHLKRCRRVRKAREVAWR